MSFSSKTIKNTPLLTIPSVFDFWLEFLENFVKKPAKLSLKLTKNSVIWVEKFRISYLWFFAQFGIFWIFFSFKILSFVKILVSVLENSCQKSLICEKVPKKCYIMYIIKLKVRKFWVNFRMKFGPLNVWFQICNLYHDKLQLTL